MSAELHSQKTDFYFILLRVYDVRKFVVSGESTVEYLHLMYTFPTITDQRYHCINHGAALNVIAAALASGYHSFITIYYGKESAPL